MIDKKTYNQWRRTGILHGLDEDNGYTLATILEEFMQLTVANALSNYTKNLDEAQRDGRLAMTCLYAIKMAFGQNVQLDISKLYDDVKEEAELHPQYGTYHNIDADVYVQEAVVNKYRTNGKHK